MTITLSGLDANADADLLLIEDINGNGMVSADEEFDREIIKASFAGELGSDEEITAILLAGEYFVVVEPFVGETNYDLSIAATTVTIPDDGAGNNGDTARDLGTLSTQEQVFSDFIGDVDDIDIYRFNLNEESEVSINLSNLSADVDWLIIQELNGNGIEDGEEFIDGSFNGGNADEIGSLRLADGEYFLRVQQFEGNTDYDLTISAAAAPELPTLSQAIDLATLNNTVNDSVADENPIDLYSFTLESTSEVTLTLEGLSANADLYLLQDINDNGEIDADGISEGEGELVNFSIEENTTSETISDFLQAGTYYVTVEQFEGNTDYALTLSTEVMEVAADANNTISEGQDLGSFRDNMGTLNDPITFSDSVGDDDPIDYYTFEIPELMNSPNAPRLDLDVRLDVRGGNADLRVILDENGNGEVEEEEVLDLSATQGNEPDFIFVPDLEPGTYLIEVEQFSGDVQYDLTITPAISNNPRDDRPDNFIDAFQAIAAGTPLTIAPQAFTGFVGGRDLADWYRFTLEENGNINIALTGLSADADLFLIADINGNGEEDAGELIFSSVNDANNDESITTDGLPAGDYFVEVGQFQGDTEYELTVFATPSSEPGIIPGIVPGNTLPTAIAQSAANFAASGEVSPGDVNDFYRFTVNRSGIFTANLTGLNADADLRLLRDFNSNDIIDLVVDRNNNEYIDKEEVEILAWLPNRDASDEQIRAFLEPGEYFLQVTNLPQKQTTSYNVETRFQAAESDSQAFDINVTLSEAAQMVLDDSLEEAVTKASEFWERVVTHSTFSGTHDISITVDVDELGEGVLASAGPTALRRDSNGNSMTVTGEARINSNPTIVGLFERDLQYFYDTMIHEFGHVLGFFGGSGQPPAPTLRRSTSLPAFNESFYLAQNPDVAAVVAAGAFASGLEHFLEHGQFEGRRPSQNFNFDEAFYLAQYPDVATAVLGGIFSTGLEHYLLFGQFESRLPSPNFNLDNQTTVWPYGRGASSTRGSRGSRGSRGTRSSQRVASLPSLTDRNLVTEDETNPVYNGDSFAGIAYGELLETFEPTALELTRGAGSGSDLSHW